MELVKKKYTYLLIEIENWDSIRNSLSASEIDLMLTHFSELISLKFGENFRSLINSSGEFFVIASYRSANKSLLKFSGELKHQFNEGPDFFPKQIIVSIALTTKDKDMEAYDILLYLRKILNLCRSEKQSNILCVA